MLVDLGVVKPGSTIRIPFSSFDKDDGSSITMTNYAAADILAYKDGSTTERASTSGYTATTDFDAKTGKHLIVIDLSDDTTADFWKSGSEYLIAIDAVTVDAVTVGGWIARFRIGYAGSILDTSIATLASQTSFTLTTGPAENDAIKGRVVLIHNKASAIQAGYGIVTAYTGATKTVTLAAGTTFTVAAGDNISIMEMAPLQAATLGRTLVVDAAGLADANMVKAGPSGSGTAQTAGDIIGDTNDIQTRLPAALVSGRMDASVGAMAANVLTATAINADAITAAKIADGAIDAATFAAGAINAAAIATDAITAAKIAADAIGASELAADAINEIADQVWDEALSGHATGGSAGAALSAAGSAGDPWSTLLPGAYGAGTAGKIVGDNVNATISSRLASASYTAPLDAAGTRSAVGLASANLDTQLTAIDDYIDTEVAAIKAKTDNLPAAPAAVSDIPTANANADALLDRANAVETSLTLRQAMRLMSAALAGKLSGAATASVVIRNVGDSKDRITATVDANGNRTAVTTDAT